MKTKKQNFTGGLILILLLISIASQSQIQFQGMISQNEGAAAWNADGSGPEPEGSGHNGLLYYVSTCDYVDPNCQYGAHATGIDADFQAFSLALSENGFTPEQVKMKVGLASMGTDLEGSDWFLFGQENFMNFYPFSMSLYLNDELMISGLANYMMFCYGPSTGWYFECESNYFVPVNVSGSSSQAVQNVAAAFIQDVGDQELRINMTTVGASQAFSGNGRNGAYFNFNASIATGHPQLPFQALAANHEGFAGWVADGTGPEPKRSAHDGEVYYVASRDYDGIDPNPDACYARLLSEGGTGFQNFALQLEYRGYSPEQVKMKMGLRDRGEDIQGEDWNLEGEIYQANYYHCNIIAELNGEPLFGFVCDTAKIYQNIANPNIGVWGTSAITSMYDASENSSAATQAVAASFFKDMEQRQIQTIIELSTFINETFSGNGRYGGFWQINQANLVAVPMIGTKIQPGEVSGHWTLSGNPYNVIGDITIPNGQTLVIDPGVWVKFATQIRFKVNGAIQAVGDTSNLGNILFTAVNPELGWGHIEYDNTSTTNPTSVYKHCIFEYGSAPPPETYNSPFNCGGALVVWKYNNIIIENCLFRYNKALNNAYWTASGGAIALGYSSPSIRNSVFIDNTANYSGAIGCYVSSPEIINCLFYGNISLRDINDGGGAIVLGVNSNPVLYNNTFVNNHSNFRGGALEIWNESNPILINNIFWGNTAPQNNQIYISSNDNNVDLKYNDIEGGQADIGPNGIGTGIYENNIDNDPGFADLLALNFQLSEGSFCIDAGTPDTTGLNLPEFDLLGNPRLVNDSVDIGAYEWNIMVGYSENAVDESFNFSVNPNPVKERLFINYDLAKESVIIIELYNTTGTLVQSVIQPVNIAGQHQLEFNTAKLQSGIYFIRLQAGNQIATKKVVKF